MAVVAVGLLSMPLKTRAISQQFALAGSTNASSVIFTNQLEIQRCCLLPYSYPRYLTRGLSSAPDLFFSDSRVRACDQPLNIITKSFIPSSLTDVFGNFVHFRHPKRHCSLSSSPSPLFKKIHLFILLQQKKSFISNE